MGETESEPAAGLRAVVPPEAAPTGVVTVMAPDRGAAGEEDAPPVGGEPSMLETASGPLGGEAALQGQPAGAGWGIVVSGAAPETRHLQDNMLSRAHQTIDRRGGSLATERPELEDECRRLMEAWHPVHEACSAQEAE